MLNRIFIQIIYPIEGIFALFLIRYQTSHIQFTSLEKNADTANKPFILQNIELFTDDELFGRNIGIGFHSLELHDRQLCSSNSLHQLCSKPGQLNISTLLHSDADPGTTKVPIWPGICIDMLLPHGHMGFYVLGTIWCFISVYASVAEHVFICQTLRQFQQHEFIPQKNFS